MKLKELYAGKGPVRSIEFFPPKTPEAEKKFEDNLPAFKALAPAFCSVTMGAGGGLSDKTVGLVKRLKQVHGFEVMCHFTCVGKSRAEVRAILDELQAGGVENIIALRGDPPLGTTEWRPHPEGFKYSVELVKEAKSYGWFSIAVAGFPETHPEAVSPEADIAYLKAKADAGADAVVSQFFFENADFLRFRDRASAAGVRIPIVPGILPVKSAAWVRKFAPLCKAKVPAEMDAALTRLASDEAGTMAFGVDWAVRQLRGLLAAGIPGYHVYCLNDPRPAGALLAAVSA